MKCSAFLYPSHFSSINCYQPQFVFYKPCDLNLKPKTHFQFSKIKIINIDPSPIGGGVIVFSSVNENGLLSNMFNLITLELFGVNGTKSFKFSDDSPFSVEKILMEKTMTNNFDFKKNF